MVDDAARSQAYQKWQARRNPCESGARDVRRRPGRSSRSGKKAASKETAAYRVPGSERYRET